MEEVWKAITLPSLPEQYPTSVGGDGITAFNNHGLSNMILQDFLARPFNKDPPRRGTSSDTSLPPPPPPPPHPAATLLSLNSASDFQCIEIGDPGRQNPKFNGGAPYLEALGSPTVSPSLYKKRAQHINDNFHDRRHKRMMKNRESAARSRARKQAYTNELELEIAHLQEENARLRRQQEKFLAAPAQLPKKHSIQRTLTAPF
ncbi:hypothetical protein SLE2022_098300 [Rubroshorea leprosula]